jgi:Flp pilus assembly protein TadG
MIVRKRQLWKRIRTPEKGQVLLLVTLAAVALVAIMGLTLDVGIMFIQNARLRRAVDAAALGAALQFREGYTVAELDMAAEDFLYLNGVNGADATVQICGTASQVASDPDHYTEDLCTNPLRKLVRVRASGIVNLAFLPVLGFDTVPIAAEATSETASVDVILVIDTSESMTWDAGAGNPMRDPSICNYNDLASAYVSVADDMPGECHPFEEVKIAAREFVEQLYFPYDRVAIITFNKHATVHLSFTDADTYIGDPSGYEDAIVATIEDLNVFEAEGICPTGNPCRLYNASSQFQLFDCPQFHVDGDPSQCTSTNIGGGLLNAGNEFAMPPIRQEALWVVILLTDGAANGGACPSTAWASQPFCRDASAATRHAIGNPDYDADDYAHDMADFVGRDQSALIFSIGLGSQVQSASSGDPDAGEQLLEYAAQDGVGNGLYYFAPSGAELRDVFQAIADNIATRLTH